METNLLHSFSLSFPPCWRPISLAIRLFRWVSLPFSVCSSLCRKHRGFEFPWSSAIFQISQVLQQRLLPKFPYLHRTKQNNRLLQRFQVQLSNIDWWEGLQNHRIPDEVTELCLWGLKASKHKNTKTSNPTDRVKRIADITKLEDSFEEKKKGICLRYKFEEKCSPER